MATLRDRLVAFVQSSGLMWLLKGSALVFGIQVAGQIAGYINQLVLARVIGPEELGNYLYATNTTALVAAMAVLGFQAGAIRFVIAGQANADPAYVRGYVRQGAIIALLGSVAMAGGLILFWLFKDRSATTALNHPAFPIALCITPLLALMTHYGTVGRALKMFTVSFLPNTLLRPLGILSFTLFLVFAGWSFSSKTVVYAFIVLMCVLTVWQVAMVMRQVGRQFDTPERTYDSRLWILTGLQLLLLGLAEGQIARINVAMSGFYLSPTETAVLNVAFTYVSPIGVGLFSLNAVMAPNASKLHAEGKTEELQNLLIQLCHFRFWPCLLAVCVLAVFGKPLLRIFGPEFETGYQALVLIAISRLIVGAFGPQTFMVTFMGLQRSAMVVFILALGILTGLNAALMPTYGLVGSGIAVIGTTLFWNIGLHVVITRRSGLVPSILCWQTAGFWPRAAIASPSANPPKAPGAPADE